MSITIEPAPIHAYMYCNSCGFHHGPTYVQCASASTPTSTPSNAITADDIEAAITEVEGAIQGDDAAAMEVATTKLTEATGGVAQKMYAAQQAEGAAAGAEGAEAQPEEADRGDVVDAEFEEVKEDKRA